MANNGQGAWTTTAPPDAEVPPVPTSTYSQAPLSPTLSQGDFSGNDVDGLLSTLDEPVWETIKRDLVRIGHNLVQVVFPFKNWDQQSAALRNWDLWGPMAFALTLAITLSLGSHQESTVFSLVFGVCAAGAIILTVNANLLGGNIGFFQSMCLLGYCLFPLDVAAIFTVFFSGILVRCILVAAGVAWASWAAIPFMGGSVPPARRALAVYPLLLLFAAMGWLALVKS